MSRARKKNDSQPQVSKRAFAASDSKDPVPAPANFERLQPLRRAYQAFRECIVSVPDRLYLTPLNGWSPRDVVAHLIGWNSLMIEASNAILNSKTPSYYSDGPNDFKNINAGFVAQYSSKRRQTLLEDLAESFTTFEKYIEGLEPSECDADHKVRHYKGGQATISRIIQSLAGDYESHRREIAGWLKTQSA